ncbi:DinB family protein [Aggregatimonas sangjinii]|uniref:DinB family protein n=1 Tax=Aggregatimonas sangjinii TaxID=2583587 RepID=A0A5B7SZA1_9FLAO|nr:DinB family protein [Aggregatimonas sangjinii]QCX02134.1 DinB family protein [Aggregatimonas sangjinii]
MKKTILPILVLTLVSFGIINTGLTDDERKMATEHLTQTKERLTSTLDGLDEEQLNFKPTAESWSIAECVEHLAIAENMFNGMLKGALKEPANTAMRDSVTMSDEKLIGFISVRDTKVKTPEPFEPMGKFGSHEETLEAFMSKRDEHIEYVKTTEDDLRNHYGKLPFATIDGLQIILFMSGHTERHVLQMEEVIAHEDFPMGEEDDDDN